MVPQALAALDQAEIADDAVIAATHASEPCPPEMIAHARQHPRSMHCLLIPSNLDAGRIGTSSLRRSQKILLDELDAVVAQDVVGGGDVKEELRRGKRQQQRLAG